MVLKQEKQFQLTSMYLAVIIASLLIVILTVGGELLPVLKTTLKNVFWHHWIGKSIVITAVFLIINFAFRKIKIWDIKRWTILLVAIWLFGNIIIFGFFVWHYLT